jgi:hypothetical protein
MERGNPWERAERGRVPPGRGATYGGWPVLDEIVGMMICKLSHAFGRSLVNNDPITRVTWDHVQGIKCDLVRPVRAGAVVLHMAANKSAHEVFQKALQRSISPLNMRNCL